MREQSGSFTQIGQSEKGFGQENADKVRRWRDALRKAGNLTGWPLGKSFSRGLPFILTVMGSFLKGKSIKEWQGAFDRLKEMPLGKVHEIPRIVVDGLEANERMIFLDIACFLNGYDKEEIIKSLEQCCVHANSGIEILSQKSLVYIDENNKVWMHDLLQEMGRQIVIQECPDNPSKRSRIWRHEDALQAKRYGAWTALEARQVITMTGSATSSHFRDARKLAKKEAWSGREFIGTTKTPVMMRFSDGRSSSDGLEAGETEKQRRAAISVKKARNSGSVGMATPMGRSCIVANDLEPAEEDDEWRRLPAALAASNHWWLMPVNQLQANPNINALELNMMPEL
ncbi:hypothetical protein NL676_038923 [Syzygium grande]|nr:hypothetical protein NL676_038923 [Syzygium grande]